ncbi:Helix-loop-helix 34 family protein [Dictyocaulus viviparus]|uniref:Helix-loop-helix 34 family protein n=1 Tax=Dictyocaulus viviparus TaxID=29172 RepID=A0A0D8XKQ3_DICVI|nr:Helix-loop-helix 34 family protein [Dictyocaulus viviparus]
MICGGNRSLAKHRRSLENGEFSNLANVLPLSRAITGQHIDKTTMVRLALSYIKLHKLIRSTVCDVIDYDRLWTNSLLELMDCFLMVLDPQGNVLYVSETISIYLGLSQVEMTGNPIAEYIHSDDWQHFYSIFCSSFYGWAEMCSVRMKSSLTKRANKKDSLRASPGFKVMRMDMTSCNGCRLVVCSSLPQPILSSIYIRNNSFVITTAVDLSILYVDSTAGQMLCECQYFNSFDLKGVSFYSVVHVDEVEIVRKMHIEVFKLGSYRPPMYRMMSVQGRHAFYVESNVFRYTSHSNKSIVDTITIVSHLL